MKKLSIFIALITILAMVVPSFAQEKGEVYSYVVFMEQAPALGLETGKVDLNSARVRDYTAALTASHDAALKASGVALGAKIHDYTFALNGFSALLTLDEVAAMEKAPGVLKVMRDEMRQLTTENSPSFLGLDERRGAWHKGITGENVIVGVIDTGIWPEHASFADDGTYSDLGLTLPCEFGNEAHNPDDAAFECNNKLLGARDMMATYAAVIGPEIFDSARDDDGHGTHTASTAAGNAGVEASIFGIPRGVVSGIAPRARVVAYKGCGELGCFGSDLTAAIDQAVADGVEVINYSIGGGASLTGSDDLAYLFAADAGVWVATSAGNSGPSAGTVGGPASTPWLTAVGASTQDRSFQGSAFSSDGWEFFGASITASSAELPLVDAADAGDELCNIGALDATVVAGNIVLCKRGAIARVDKSHAVFVAGGAGMILYNASDSQSQVTDNHFVPSVHINNTDGLVIKSYIASDPDPTAMINGGVATTVPAPWMAAFSSRGSNSVAEDIIKPDVTAPGVQILAGNTPIHFVEQLGPQGELFQAIAGTSMSSPHVAGLFALLKQAHPDWSPAMAKSAIMTTAYQDVMKEDGATPADPFDFGAGHIDPSGWVYAGSPARPGLVYDAGFFEYLGFLCDAEPTALSPTTCPFLESLGVPTDASDLNLASIGIAELPGSQTVVRTVTNLTKWYRVYRVMVEAPEGYNVKVSPSVLLIGPGESLSYEVTITNDGTGVIGEWSFGSLTWKSGGYMVRSPIAVKGALFDAPAQVDGTGTEGSASFDVTFGYEGDYTAAPHGLEPDVIVSGNVVQDPDQTFDPTDGFSTPVEFNLSGAAFFKLVMNQEDVDDENVDLDIFVYDPSGVQVANSTSGGTVEEIGIVLPADGTWTVYIHGWQTGDGASDFDLHSWVVSATPGGSLSLDSYPAAAVVGATEPIDVSWTGLAPDMMYLGAVSHADAGGLIGLTLVSVDTMTATPASE